MKTLKQLIIRTGHRFLVMWWFFRRPQTRGVKGVLFNQTRDSVLLVKLSYAHKKWSIPGGGVGKNESEISAIIRELIEEVGVVLDPAELLEIGVYTQNIEFKSDTVTCFAAQLADTRFVVDGTEIQEARWFSLEELPHDRTASVDRILEVVLRHQ